MTGKQFFFIAILSLIVGAIFLTLGLLLLSGLVRGEMGPGKEPPREVGSAPAAPPGQEMGFVSAPVLVTDPQAVALTLDEMPLDFQWERAESGYVDNGQVLNESLNPRETWLEIELTGRLNGYRVVFASEDPAAHVVYILNLVHVYRSVEGARQAFATSLPYIPFPRKAPYTLEEVPTTPIGGQARAWRISLPAEGPALGAKAAWILLFQCNNALVELVLLGRRDYALGEEAAWYAQSVDRRIRSFGRGQTI